MRSEQEDSNLTRLVNFYWPHAGKDVRLTGDFTGWDVGIQMHRDASTERFTCSLRLKTGTVQAYKFIVDGEWIYSPLIAFKEDQYGNINNIVVVPMEINSDEPLDATSTKLTTPSAQSLGKGGYIGAGVMREHQEEFGIPVELSASNHRRRMTRSKSTGAMSAPVGKHHHGNKLSLESSATSTPSSGTRDRGQSDIYGHSSLPGERMEDIPEKSSTSQSDQSVFGIGDISREHIHGIATTDVSAIVGTRTDHIQFNVTASAPVTPLFGASSLPAENTSLSSFSLSPPKGSSRGPDSRSTADGPPARPSLMPSASFVSAAVGVPVTIPIDKDSLSSTSLGIGTPASLSGAAGPMFSPQSGPVSFGGHNGLLSGASLPPSASPFSTTSFLSTPGARRTAPPLSTAQALLRREGKLVLAMVGLPARGKTFMARRLKRHLSWMGYRIEIFNVGNYRRKLLGANQPHDFFDPLNREGEQQRSQMAKIAFEEMVQALKAEQIDIAIFDATNSTVDRRRWLLDSLAERDRSYRLVFVESVCNDEEIIKANVRETKLKSPDYRDVTETEAVSDFLRRIGHYVSVYQPLGGPEEEEVSYIKLIDVGRMIIANRINGFLNSRVMFFLSNLHITPRPIWITRHGESEFNVQGRIGGDSALSPRGQGYALRLAAFMNALYPPGSGHDLVVWTSTLRRTQLTAAPLGREIVTWKALDEVDAGVCDGMTYEAIAATMPDEYAARAKNKFTYRYPRGESYEDIVQRLEPIIIELTRQRTPVLIVSHQATLRVLYAYLTDKPPETCPDVLLPLHTVVQLTQKAYGAEEVRHEIM